MNAWLTAPGWTRSHVQGMVCVACAGTARLSDGTVVDVRQYMDEHRGSFGIVSAVLTECGRPMPSGCIEPPRGMHHCKACKRVLEVRAERIREARGPFDGFLGYLDDSAFVARKVAP